MAIRMKQPVFDGYDRSDFCAPLKAFGGKEETGKAPENGAAGGEIASRPSLA
jgi:hypothetical protein